MHQEPSGGHFLRRFGLAGALLVSMAISIGAGVSSLALFTDSDDVTGNAFTAGTIILGASPTSALVSFSDMLPGDVVYGALTLTNSGTGALRYSMTTAATNADTKNLRDQLEATIREKAAGTCAADFTGAVVDAAGSLASAAFGDSTAGDDTGDRPLAASGSEILCFKVELPSDTGNPYQGAATTATFTFASEQTANNP